MYLQNYLQKLTSKLTRLLLGQVLLENPGFLVAVKSCPILLTVAVVKLVVSYLYTDFSDWPVDLLGLGDVKDLLLHFADVLEVNKE